MSASSSAACPSAAAGSSTTAARKRTHALVQSTITMHAKPKEEATSSVAAATAEPAAAAAASPAKRSRKAASSASAAPAASSYSSAAADSSYWTYCPSVIPAVAASSTSPARSASAECDRFFTELRALVNPVPGRIFVYGKHHEERRLTGVYARAAGDFSYSGKTTEASGVWPAVLQELHEIAVKEASRVQRIKEGRAESAMEEESKEGPAAAAASSSPSSAATAAAPSSVASPFPLFHWDTVLINFYRDGSDSISWHSDKDCVDSTIASFSFGAEREFFIRQRPAKGASSSSSGSTKSLRSWSQLLQNGSLLLMHPGMQSRFHHSLPARKGVTKGRINVTFRSHGRTVPNNAEGGSPAAAAAAASAPKHVRG